MPDPAQDAEHILYGTAYGESLAASVRRRQREIDAEFRADLDRCTYANPKKGTDPMSHPISINISIAEIANGVIVTTDLSEGYGLSSGLGNGSYYPSLADAIDQMPAIVTAAWDRAQEQQRAYEKQRYVISDHRPPTTPYPGSKLPEETAVTSEPIPVVDETERDSAFIRTDPVMSTSSFDIDTSEGLGEK